MAKYTLEFKLEIVEYYLSGQGGFRKTGKLFGLDYTMIRKWVDAYKQHGLKGIAPKKQRTCYTVEFKESLLQEMWKSGLSYRAIATKYNIPAMSTIMSWEKRYNEGGINSLSSKQGKYPRLMGKTALKQPTLKPDKQKTHAELLDEIEYLRAEVEYLKKLEALIQGQERNTQKVKRK